MLLTDMVKNMKKTSLLFIISVVTFMFMIPSVYAEEAVDTWDTLSACLSSLESKTCKLSKNIEAEAGKNYIFMKNTGDKTLDLGGFTLSMSQVIYTNSVLNITGNSAGKIIGPNNQHFMIMAMQGGTLDIKNITLEAQTGETCGGKKCEGQAISISGINNKVTVESTATINAGYGVMFQAYNEHYDQGGNGSVLDFYGTINVTTSTGTGITIQGSITGGKHIISENAPVVNVYSGAKIISEQTEAIYGAGYGFYNIKGGYIQGTGALSIKSGVYNITGGTLKATGSYNPNPEVNGSGSESTGAAVSITSNDTYDGHIKVFISGNPQLISEHGNALYETLTNSSNTKVEEIKISGGDFESAKGIASVLISDELQDHNKNFISGGDFSEPLNKNYIAENLIQDENGNVVAKNSTELPSTTNSDVDDTLNPDTADVNLIVCIILIIASICAVGYVIKKRYSTK